MKQKIPFYVTDETSLTIFIKSPQILSTEKKFRGTTANLSEIVISYRINYLN
jgi:hypothetical protein